jgi:hypothetical protein
MATYLERTGRVTIKVDGMRDMVAEFSDGVCKVRKFYANNNRAKVAIQRALRTYEERTGKKPGLVLAEW